MITVFKILAASIPLLFVSFGALVSEHTGRMALFLDGMINFSSFLCFALTIATKSLLLGIFLTLLICIALIIIFDVIIQKTKANSFIAAMAINLFLSALVSALSFQFFKTRGTLVSEYFIFDATKIRLFTTVFGILILCISGLLLKFSKLGIFIRITGNNSDVLITRGLNPNIFKTVAWVIATIMAVAAGCTFSVRLSSFVPNISSGIGWLALAAVFMGKTKTAKVLLSSLIFSAAQYGASNLQNIQGLNNFPSAILIALPYITALIFILFSNNSNKTKTLQHHQD